MNYVGRRAGASLDAIKYSDVMLGHTTVTTEQRTVCIRPDNGDGLKLRRIEREKLILVLEQGNDFTSGLTRNGTMFITTHDTFRLSRINVRIIEEPQFKFPEQHRRNQFVELLFLQHPPADKLRDMQIAIRIRQFDIHADFH